MNKLYPIINAKSVSVSVRTFLFVLIATVLLSVPAASFAQCTGCTSTINNNSSFTVGPGQTVCLTKNNYNGTITLNGGTLCIAPGITVNPSWVYSAASTINDNGTIGTALTVGNGYILNINSGASVSATLTESTGGSVSNTGTVSGTLTQNGGTFTNNSGGIISGSSSINGTLINNGSMTNTISIGATGSLTNNNSITGNITSMASGASFINASAGTITDNISSSAGSTITNSGTMTINGGTISGTFITTSGSTTTNTNGTINGTSTIGGTMANNATMSGTITVSATGTLSTGSNLSGTLIINGTFNVNGGASPTIASVTVNNGGIINNRGTIQGGTLTANAGSTINNYSIINDATSESGTLNNFSGGTISATLTGNAGSVITNFSGAQITAPVITSGTLNNNSGATISNPVTENAGGNVTNAGTMSAGATINGGTFVDAAGGSITNGGTYNITVNGGNVTLNANVQNVSVTGGTLNNNATIGSQINVSGGSVNNSGTISGSYTQNGGTVNNSGTFTPSSLHLNPGTDSLTNLAGGAMTFPSGSNTLPSGLVVTNFGTFTIPAGTNPLIVSAGATLNLEGTQNMGSTQLTDNGTINLLGNLTVSTYAGSGSLNEINPGCNTLSASSNTGTGTFNGGASPYGGGLIVNSYSGSSTYSNGASATVTAPTLQPTGLGLSVSNLAVSGSFTSPSATIAGYIVLRYIGTSAPACNPVNNTSYTVGNTIGACTVVAIVTSGSTGVKTFTDNIPSTSCGNNAYYEIFSYNGAGGCVTYDLTGPLTGSVAIPIPTAVITPSGATTFCTGSTVNLVASGGNSYAWSNSVNTAANNGINTSGTYIVTVTNAAGCTATASQVVTVNTFPAAVTVGGAGTFCGSATLTATGGVGGTIYWENTTSNGTSTATPSSSQSVSASGTYYFRANNGCGWGTQGSAAVTINALPAVAAIGGTTTVCVGSTILLTDGTLGGTWSSSNTAVATVSALGTVSGVSKGTATITYTVTNILTGCQGTATSTITVNDVPSAVTVSPASAAQCGGTVTLTASGGTNGTIYWENTFSNGTSTATPSTSQVISASGTYAFRANNACGWGTQGTALVTINPYPVVSPITGTTSVCAGSTTTLSDATASGTWSSSNTAVATISAGGVVSGLSAGTSTISYTVISGAGCSTTVTTTVTVNAVPVVAAITGTTNVCAGSTVTLSDASASGVWSSSNTGVATISAGGVVTGVAAGTTTISYAVTNAAGCVTTVNTAVTGYIVPTATTVSGGTTQCGGTVTLTASGGTGGTIYWENTTSNGTSTATPSTSQSVSATGTYYFRANSICGWGTQGSASVTINALPVVAAITGTTTVCAGSTTTLSDATASGVWSSSNTGVATINASGVVSGLAAGTTIISYTVTNGLGCSTAATTTVTVNALPTPTVNSPTMCAGTSATLNATGGLTYSWSTAQTGPSITVSPASSTVYVVTATNAAGCTAAVSGVVSVVANPTVTVTNPATCAGGIDTLVASGGGTYVWSTGASTSSITTTIAGVYNVTVTNSSGCSATGSGIATVNPIPTPTVANDTICSGAIATLTANSGVVYVWSNGAHTASMTTATAGTYTVTVTNLGSCTATASGTVVIVANPTVTATNGVICSGSPTSITASGAASYVWNTGNTTASVTVSTTGTYTVTGTSTLGCTASATSSVSAAANPSPAVNSPAICAGATTSLTATGGATYLWSTGATTAAISMTPATTTTYTVTATSAVGCSATASGTVTVNALPAAAATSAAVCSGTSATLTASGGGTYHWSTGATTASITTLVAGTYTVTVTNAAGCTASASGTATVAIKPVATVNSASVCTGTAQTLTATITAGGPCTYLWSTAATTASISVSPLSNTTYTVTVTNAAGCTASASGAVTVYNVPAVVVGSNSPVLLNGTINLTSTVSSGTSPYTYSWSGPSSFISALANPSVASAQPTNSGAYNVTVTDAHGCTAIASTSVILNFTSPGGIPSNDALWLMANAGVTTAGSNLTKWNDQSGLTNNATVINGTAPTLVNNSVNSYPVVNFAGTGGAQGYFGNKITSSSVTSFIVANAATASSAVSGMFSIVAAGGTDHSNTNSAVLFQKYSATGIGSVRNNATDGNYTGATTMAQYHLLTSIYSGAANTNYFYHEGVAATSAAYPSTAFADTIYTVGSRYAAGAGNYLTGQIGEVILFNTALSAAQKNQVESYLATKYGFTLDQTTATNYVASNGTIFWNAASNGTYNNNIFGVGIDNISTLSQTQSVSINTSILSISNATGLSFYSFLMVSDNAGANTLTSQTNLPNSINAAISKVWRVSQTGGRASANYVFNSSSTSFGYYAPISSSMTVYMLIDSNADGIYESYQAPVSTAGTINTFNASLNDGARFTFGFKASIDFGDAWGVATTITNNGAAHLIVPGVYLGALIDGELDGQPSVNALGDDTIGVADEDGVNFNIGVPTNNNIVTMGSNTIIVTASVPGYLNAWIDLNQDNTYGGGSEYEIQNIHLVAGANTVTFNVSDSVLYGPTSMRFRFDTISGDANTPTGLAKNGEVEDYKVYITAPLVGPCTNGFQNPSFEMGPAPSSYTIVDQSNLPYWRTTATDHMIEQWQSGFLGVPAYNGSYFMELEANLYGALYQDVYTTPGTKLSWSFAHRGRSGSDTAQLRMGAPGATVYQATAIDGTSAWGIHSGFYTVPAGQYITRLEFWAIGSYGGNTSIGNFLDQVSVISSFDYGDAPNSYGTLFTSNGPYHSITNNLYLGYGETCDADGQPSTGANLDSLDDGITFPTPCASCNTYTVNINAFNNSGSPATIAGWIDFNKNGVFDANERASVTIPSSAVEQATSITFSVSAYSATSSGTYARFRIANDSTQIATPYGFASTGEVEDYQVPCIALPIPVPTANTPACARGPLTLTSTGSASFFAWSGPNGFTSSSQDTALNTVPAADSGLYRVYAIYSNGCERDSSVYVHITNCYINISGNIFDDANGNGLIDGTDATTDHGQVVYAVLSDNTNTVLQTTLIAANGAFNFTNAPAYTTGMTIITKTTNPAVGGSSGGSQWPANWVGTKEQYGANNLAGSGVDATPNLLVVNAGVNNITGALLGYDQLPTTVGRTYLIPYPSLNSQKPLTPGSGFGVLGGSDPEDGTFAAGSTFTITSLAGMNGNTLYYDANGDGILQPYEQITGFTTITNFDPSKLIIKFTGAGSTSATFNYGTTDAAGKVDPAPAPYVIKWIGALPVKMLYFEAERSGNSQSLLKWATASEIDNDHFEIERSADAETWEKIGQVKGAGTTEIQTNYSLIDAEPLNGINYYRLKQVDVDGNYTYSEIAQVTFAGLSSSAENTTTLAVYPNPMNQSSKLNIALASETENINEVSIVNEIGQVVYSTAVPQIQNYQILGLNLPSGVYIVTVHTQANNLLTSRLVIAH